MKRWTTKNSYDKRSLKYNMKFKARYKFGEITKRWGDAEFKRDFDGILDNWLKQFTVAERKLILELLKNFYYYTEIAINEKVVELHQRFLEINGCNINNVVFTKMPKEYGVANSDLMFLSYWFNNEIKGYSTNDVVRELLEQDAIPKTLVVVDDFIGSGDTAIKGLKRMLNTAPDLTNSKIYLLAIHASKIGIENIDNFINKLDLNFEFIYLDSTEPAFKEDYIFQKIEAKIKKAEYIAICEDKNVGNGAILGYKDIQSLVAFEKTTPNDTLGLFWHSAENFVSLFRATKTKRTTSLSSLKGIARKNSHKDGVLFDIEDNQYNKFIVYCVIHGQNFSAEKACSDFGITPELLQKRLDYISRKKYIVIKNGKIMPTDNTEERIIRRKLKGWENAEKALAKEGRIPLRETTYIPRNFAQSFSGYKK